MGEAVGLVQLVPFVISPQGYPIAAASAALHPENAQASLPLSEPLEEVVPARLLLHSVACLVVVGTMKPMPMGLFHRVEAPLLDRLAQLVPCRAMARGG